jgi:hypothetical protein
MKKNQDKSIKEDTTLDEVSAIDTLKPGAGSSEGQTHAQTLSTFTTMLAQLGKEDLSKLYTDTIASIGKEASLIPDGSAAKNKSTITTKEDVDDIFVSDDLSEDVKEKAAIVFEAAINTKLILEKVRLEEEYEERVKALDEAYEIKLEEEVIEVFEEVAKQTESYMDFVVESWLDENTIAIENNLKLEITEEFMTGLRNLFSEHYIELPEDKLDVLGEMKVEIEELKTKLNSALHENIELSSSVVETAREKIISNLSEGMVLTDSEKLKSLVEGVEFSDIETFEKKAKIIKENYFGGKKTTPTGMITENIDVDIPNKNVDTRLEEFRKAMKSR